MKLSRFVSIMTLCAFVTFACEPKVDPDDPGKGKDDPQEEVDGVINGTTIEDGMTAVGLVSDAGTGKGIAGVPVTDGYNYVVTDANGVYQMKANRYCRTVYISVPSEYEIPLDDMTHLPAFYKYYYRAKGVNRMDFKLKPQAVEDKFTLFMIGDPQCQTTAQVDRYKTETVPAMINTINNAQKMGRYPNPYGVTLGDITFDSTNLWDDMKNSMSKLKLSSGKWFPIFQCIGNHDHNSLVKTSDYDAVEEYINHFGPTDYSFNRGQAHIIVMDDIACSSVKSNSSPNKATWEYSGGISQIQYKWLAEDIAQVSGKENKLVFICMHIPMRGGAASGGATFNTDAFYKEVKALLKGFKEAHIMIGHTHYNQNYIHTGDVCKGGLPIYEHIHGAACGSWWSCNSNVTGGPNGFSVYEIEGNSVVDWVTIGTKNTPEYQMRIYDGDQIYTGTRGYEYAWNRASNVGGSSNITAKGNANFKNAFVAEVFNDDDKNWKVEMWQNGAKVGDFRRIDNGGSCNVCVAAYYFNELGKNTDTWVNKTASHYWYFVPSSKKPSSETNWEVRATQTIPGSGRQHVYTCASLTTDYGQF